MDHVESLVQKYFGVVEGMLQVGGVPISRIVEQFGTPLFVYDASVLDKKWDLLRRTLPDCFAIYYSVKANPNRSIIRYFLGRGAGLEVASGGEFHQAVQAGCAPGDILFAGPGKTEAELEQVLKSGIGEIHIESIVEAERVSAISRRLGVIAQTSLRINPSGEAQGGAMRMGGKPAAFGVDEEQSETLIDRLMSDTSINFRGIHIFAGTQILDDTILIAQYRKGIELAKKVSMKIGRPLHTVDFGGGLGIPYFPQEHELNMDRLAEHLGELMATVQADPFFAGTRFIVEPGRFLVGESGIYVTRVTDVKVSRGKTFVILDGGMNHHLAASGNLGQVIKRNFPAAVFNRLQQTPENIVDLVGPLCTPLDTLARDLKLPRIEVGDVVGIFQSGAYGRTSSPLGFLGHPTPAEVLVQKGQVGLIRRRGTYDELTSDMVS